MFGAVLLFAFSSFAHGVPPQTLEIMPYPQNASGVVVSTTFGLLLSKDRCTYQWICPDQLGFSAREQPVWRVSSSGAIFAGGFSGLFVSRDRGCSFEPVAGFESTGASTVDEVEGTLWVSSGKFGVTNGVWFSTDDGKRFVPTSLSRTAFFFNGVKVAPSNPRRVYVSGWYFQPLQRSLFVSDDSGGSFSEVTPTPLPSGNVFAVHAVDPSNADLVYASVTDDSTVPEKTVLLRSADAGRTFLTVLSAEGRVSSMVSEGGRFWAAIGDRVYQSGDGLTWQPLPSPKQRACVARVNGETLVCGRVIGEDQFAVASVESEVTPLLTWDRISGPIQCPANSTGAMTCAVAWTVERAELGLAPDATPACGTPMEPPMPPKKAGCSAADGLALSLGGFFFFRKRRRGVSSPRSDEAGP
jgi:hypothetical protein